MAIGNVKRVLVGRTASATWPHSQVARGVGGPVRVAAALAFLPSVWTRTFAKTPGQGLDLDLAQVSITQVAGSAKACRNSHQAITQAPAA